MYDVGLAKSQKSDHLISSRKIRLIIGLITFSLLFAGSANAQDSTSVLANDSVISQPTYESTASNDLPVKPISYGPAMDQIYAGYQNGFLIASRSGVQLEGNEYPFLLRINSWFQLRHSYFSSDGPNQDQNSFSFERLRFSFGGHFFKPELQYFFQFDGNSDRSNDTIFLDYFGTYDFGSDLLCLKKDSLGFKYGKWKVPFSRSREESGRRLQFTDRATANVLFDLNRSIGVGLYGRLEPLFVPINFETAVFNGFKMGGTSTSRGTDMDRNFGWSLRTFADLGSEFGSDGEADLSWHENPALRLGAAVAFTRVDIEGPNEFSRQRVVDSGETLASRLPVDVTAYNVSLFTVDSHYKYRGLSFISEYFWRNISGYSGASVPNLTDHGFVLQSGYFICPERLELLARWSRIVGNSGTLGLSDESSDEIAGGLVWYFKGHNAKLTTDLTHINGVPVSSNRLEMRPGDTGWLLRTQLQLAF